MSTLDSWAQRGYRATVYMTYMVIMQEEAEPFVSYICFRQDKGRAVSPLQSEYCGMIVIVATKTRSRRSLLNGDLPHIDAIVLDWELRMVFMIRVLMMFVLLGAGAPSRAAINFLILTFPGGSLPSYADSRVRLQISNSCPSTYHLHTYANDSMWFSGAIAVRRFYVIGY